MDTTKCFIKKTAIFSCKSYTTQKKVSALPYRACSFFVNFQEFFWDLPHKHSLSEAKKRILIKYTKILIFGRWSALEDYLSVLPHHVRESLRGHGVGNGKEKNYARQERLLQELRFRIGCPITACFGGQEYFLGEDGPCREKDRAFICRREDIEDITAKASRYSVYAYQEELKQGFFTLPGGHRLGVTGGAVMENGRIITLSCILSLCLRIAHEKKDCALPLLPFIFQKREPDRKEAYDSKEKGDYVPEILNTLIISPPGGGKTTLLRDLIRQISNGTRFHSGMTVGVVDERWELGACFGGEIQNDLGIRSDVLCGGNKPEGMMMLLRSMSPQVIAADEIGGDEDAVSIRNAGNSGCNVIASAHGTCLSEILERSCFSTLHKERTFGLYVVLGNRRRPGQIRQILDKEGRILFSEGRGLI